MSDINKKGVLQSTINCYSYNMAGIALCSRCGSQLNETYKFCPKCGEIVIQQSNPDFSDICVHTYDEAKGSLRIETNSDGNRSQMVCGICNKDFPRNKYYESVNRKSGRLKWKIIAICLIIIALFLILIPRNNYSYDVGYDLGISGAIGQMRFSASDIGTASQACKYILELSLIGTPSDGIRWDAIIEEEYLRGCLEGTRQAHPGADWIE
jgi:hypothetical protein